MAKVKLERGDPSPLIAHLKNDSNLLDTEIHEVDNPYSKISVYKFAGIDFGKTPSIIGIDPGQTNSGVALIRSNKLWAYQIKYLPTTGTVQRIEAITYTISRMVTEWLDPPVDMAIVEQAAYNMPYGQAGLAEARVACIVGCMMGKIQHIECLPPATWRKRAFGNGKLKAEVVWPDLPKDASSAIGIALAGWTSWHERTKNNDS